MNLFSPYLLLTCASGIVADLTWDSAIFITTPPTVHAGVPFNATVNVDWHGLADSSYAYAFRIYLGTSYKEKRFTFYHAECYLNSEQSLCDPSIIISEDSININGTSISVTIPPTVGPSGKHYAVMGRILNTDGSYYGSEWQSDVFDLKGANGTWGNGQKQGYQLWGDDGMSCTGFACVKDCAGATDTSTGGDNDAYRECANSCPSVDIDWSSTRGGQPTAAMTKPTACPRQAEVTSVDTMRTATASMRNPTRSAADSVATGAASHCSQSSYMSTTLWFVAIVLAVW